MADETQTETSAQESKAERAKRIREFKEKHPERVQTVPSNGPDSEFPAALTVEPEKPVEPKTFPVLHSRMGNIDSYHLAMEFRDVAKYCCYAQDLYGNGTDTDVVETWQRFFSKSRLSETANYLTQPVHFFPNLVVVPAREKSIEMHTNGDGHVDSVTVHAKGLAFLDGQHRGGGIFTVLEKAPHLAGESIGITIANIPVDDIELKQQVFADVNRTPKKVSKLLGTLFDMNDHAGQVAKHLAMLPRFSGLVDMARLSPLRKNPNALSYMNLYNLLKPMADVLDDANGYLLDEESMSKILDSVVDNLPYIHGIRKGVCNFETAHGQYVIYYSPTWQALGTVLGEMLQAKNADGSSKHPVETFAQTVDAFMKRVGSNEGWDLSQERWTTQRQVGSKSIRFVDGGSVGTQKNYVTCACMILRDFVE